MGYYLSSKECTKVFLKIALARVIFEALEAQGSGLPKTFHSKTNSITDIHYILPDKATPSGSRVSQGHVHPWVNSDNGVYLPPTADGVLPVPAAIVRAGCSYRSSHLVFTYESFYGPDFTDWVIKSFTSVFAKEIQEAPQELTRFPKEVAGGRDSEYRRLVYHRAHAAPAATLWALYNMVHSGNYQKRLSMSLNGKYSHVDLVGSVQLTAADAKGGLALAEYVNTLAFCTKTYPVAVAALLGGMDTESWEFRYMLMEPHESRGALRFFNGADHSDAKGTPHNHMAAWLYRVSKVDTPSVTLSKQGLFAEACAVDAWLLIRVMYLVATETGPALAAKGIHMEGTVDNAIALHDLLMSKPELATELLLLGDLGGLNEVFDPALGRWTRKEGGSKQATDRPLAILGRKALQCMGSDREAVVKALRTKIKHTNKAIQERGMAKAG
jgi:hypothetical protein